MKTLKLSVLALSFLTPFCTFAANVYMTENSSFDVFGRVQALVMNGDGAYPDLRSGRLPGLQAHDPEGPCGGLCSSVSHTGRQRGSGDRLPVPGGTEGPGYGADPRYHDHGKQSFGL